MDYVIKDIQGDEAFRARLGLTRKQPKRPVLQTCKSRGLRPSKVRVYDECEEFLAGNPAE